MYKCIIYSLFDMVKPRTIYLYQERINELYGSKIL